MPLAGRCCTTLTLEDIIALAAVDQIVAAIAGQRVIATATVDIVIALAAVNPVVATIPEKTVIPVIAEDRVASRSVGMEIVALLAFVDRVVARGGPERIPVTMA